MAETILNAGLTISRWRKNYFREYTRASRFAPYMGRGQDNIIVTMYELQTEAGKTIIVPFIGKLTGSGVSGSQVLEGNEEDLGSGNMPVSIESRTKLVTEYSEVGMRYRSRPSILKRSSRNLASEDGPSAHSAVTM